MLYKDSRYYSNESVILMEFLSMAALEVVILTTGSAIDENFIKMMTYAFVVCYEHNVRSS